MVSKDRDLKEDSKISNQSAEESLDSYVKNLSTPLIRFASEFYKNKKVEFNPPKIISYEAGKKNYKDLEFDKDTMAEYSYKDNVIIYSQKLESYLKLDKNYIDFIIAHELGHAVHDQLFKYRYPKKQIKSVKIRNLYGSESLKVHYTGEGIANLIGSYLFLNLKGSIKPTNKQLISTLIDTHLNTGYSDSASDTKSRFKNMEIYTKKFRPSAPNLLNYDKENQDHYKNINGKSKYIKFEDLTFNYILGIKNETDSVKSEIKNLFDIKFNYLYSNFDIIKLLERGKSINYIIKKKSKKLSGKYYEESLKFINSKKYNKFIRYGNAALRNIPDLNKLIEFVSKDSDSIKNKNLKEVRKELKRKLRFKRKRKIRKELDLDRPINEIIKNSKKTTDLKRFIRYGLKVDKYLNKIEDKEKKILDNEDKD